MQYNIVSPQDQKRMIPPRYNPKQVYSPTSNVTNMGQQQQVQQQVQQQGQQQMSKLVEHLSPDSRMRMQQHIHQNSVLMASPVVINMNKSVEDLAGKTRTAQRKSTSRKDYNYQDENSNELDIHKRIVVEEKREALKEKVSQFEVLTEREELLRYKTQILPDLERKLSLVVQENERLNVLATNQNPGNSTVDLQKVSSLENKLFCTTAELEKLNRLLSDKHLENEQLIKRLGETEGMSKRIQELETSLLIITTENQKLNKVVICNHETIDSLNKACDEFEKKLREKSQIEHDISKKFKISDDLERRLDCLAMENEKVNSMLLQKNKDLEESKGQTYHYKGELERLCEVMNQQHFEHEKLTNRCVEMESSLNGLEGKIKLLLDENEKLTDMLTQRNDDIVLLQSELTENLQTQRSQSVNAVTDLEKSIQKQKQLEEECKQWVEKYIELDKQFSEYMQIQNELEKQQQIMSSLEGKIEVLIEENQKLQTQLQEKIEELEDCNKVINETDQKMRDMEDKIMILAEDNSRLQEISFKLNEEYQKAQFSASETRNQESELKNKNRECERLKDKLKILIEKSDTVNEICMLKGQELEDLQIAQSKYLINNQRNEECLERKSKENENLFKMMKEKDNQLKVWGDKFEELGKKIQMYEEELISKKSELFELQTKAATSAVEFDRLNYQLEDKTREAKELNQNKERLMFENKNAEERIGFLNKEVAQLNDVITVKMDNVQHWQVKYFELEKSVGSYSGLREENQILKSRLSESEMTCSNLKSEKIQLVDNLKSVAAENEENKETIFDLEAKVTTLAGEHEKLEELIRVQTAEVSRMSEEIMKLSTQNVEMEVRVATMNNDNQRLSEALHSVNRKPDYSERCSSLEHELRVNHEITLQIRKENADLSEKLRVNDQTLTSLKLETQKLNERNEEASDIENKLGLMIMENDKLLEINEERVKDIETLKESLQKAEVILRDKNCEVEGWIRKYTNLLTEIEELKTQCESLKNPRESEISCANEGETAQMQTMYLRDQLNVSERHIEQLKGEIKRLNENLYEKARRLEALERGNGSGELNYRSGADDLISRQENEIQSLRNQISQWKSANDSTKGEVTKLYDLLRVRKEDFESLSRNLIEKTSDANRLAQEKKDLSLQADDLLARIKYLERENEFSFKEREEFRALADKRAQDINSKTLELSQRLEELQRVKRKYEDAIASNSIARDF